MKQKRKPFRVEKRSWYVADSARGFRIRKELEHSTRNLVAIVVIVVGLCAGLLTSVYAFFSDTMSGNLNATSSSGPADLWEFECTKNIEIWTAPYSGVYELEVWGAQGGSGGWFSNSAFYSTGGKGGYATGKINLTSGDQLYVRVGCEGEGWNPRNQKMQTGTSSTKYGGFGGGGNTTSSYPSAGGGGASDMRILADTFNNRVIVAGGGGGGGNANNGTQLSDGGPGGGTTATTLPASSQYSNRTPGGGSSQTAGGANHSNNGGGTALFGVGANSIQNLAGGGGGGWYGGGVGDNSTGGGGGSGYVLTSSSHKPAGYAVGSQYYMTDTLLVGGDNSMPAPAGGTQTGQPGHGFACIKLITSPPTITLVGNDPYIVPQGSVYSDPGATAHDAIDGDISASIIVNSSAVNMSIAGTYQVTYMVTNSFGLIATETRTVLVISLATDFNCTNSITSWTVPLSGQYKIETWGAQGGTVNTTVGYQGAYAISEVTLTQGDVLKILPGCLGGYGAGGGGSFVTDSSDVPLAVAGGGGGRGGLTANGAANQQTSGSPANYGQAGQNGGSTNSGGGGTSGSGGNHGITNAQAPGGGGLLGDGANGTSGSTGGKSFVSGGLGGAGAGTALSSPLQPPGNGGFGGGAGSYNNNGGGYFRGGGGGGYSGGQGGTYSPDNTTNSGGGGGGSYATGPGANTIAGNAVMPAPSGGTQTGQSGNGLVRISNIISPPVITLLGDNPLYLPLGDAWSDPGATAHDAIDGDLTVSISVNDSSLDVNTLGTYNVIYSVTNSFGVTATIVRTVEVVQSTVFNFTCSNNVELWTVPLTGRYRLETWGAQGGGSSGGKGGYSVGEVVLTAGTDLHVAVGCSGDNGGWNGGGINANPAGGISNGGGGGTDIRVNVDSLLARVIVAGGGGGMGATSGNGGVGGGTSGTIGSGGAGPGTPTAGGVGYCGVSSNGSFGLGGDNTSCAVSGGGTGGGGWYGGGVDYMNFGGGGGSGFAFTSSSTNLPVGYLLSSQYQMSSASTTAGNASFLSPAGVAETGHTGNGYARVTILALSPTIQLLGSDPLTITQGGSFVDPGATASDPVDGDLTSSIVVSTGGLNTSVPGTYTVTYSITNSVGLTATVTRTVIVLMATVNFYCTNAVQTLVVPFTGQYKIETWGADGGVVSTSANSSKGGYSSGIVNLTVGETLYIYVGCQGEALTTPNYINLGGFNGGGAAKNSSGTGTTVTRTGGGGATDIRILVDSLYNRIIVAGGGGGNSAHAVNQTAGNGGGFSGTNGNFGNGGTQSAGGSSQAAGGTISGFGVGASNTTSTVGGGGGGWYGGGNGNGAGGGSGYVLTSSSIKPAGYFMQNANYYLSSPISAALNQAGFVTNPVITGHGYARITKL